VAEIGQQQLRKLVCFWPKRGQNHSYFMVILSTV